ncbi:MAG: ABC transporter permease [Flavobacteriales bacterium]|nr:ABC transporter permease [Flavobacteriales bacterium]
MFTRILAHLHKELLLLLRDRTGLLLVYVMPIFLVSVMAVVQDAPFRDFSDKQVRVLFKDLDGGPVGEAVLRGLEATGSFTITDGQELDEVEFRERVRRGEHQIGVVVPANATEAVAARSEGTMALLFDPLTGDSTAAPAADSSSVLMVVDPAVKHVFRELVRSSLGARAGRHQLRNGCWPTCVSGWRRSTATPCRRSPWAVPSWASTSNWPPASSLGNKVASDTTAHNVPAWTIFAMFFTVVLLAGNMVKEAYRGAAWCACSPMPGTVAERLVGRIAAYLMVCLTQLALLLSVGHWVLPLFGLPPLRFGPPEDLLLLVLAALFIGLAATSFGVLVGSFSRTQQQSAILGSTAVVIMSAIGGIWVPLYIMPGPMQVIGRISPSTGAWRPSNVVMLRQGDLAELVMYLIPL